MNAKSNDLTEFETCDGSHNWIVRQVNAKLGYRCSNCMISKLS